ncbi:MAG: DNA alkylation repair protein [Nitrospinota bacterium]
MTLKALTKHLRSFGDPDRAKKVMCYFKAGPGEYGEGDIFLGIKVPVLRAIARKFKGLSFSDTTSLLKSKFHEERFVALVLLVGAYKSGNQQEKERIFELYCSHTKFINNWDLVDISAEHIMGAYLENKPKEPLYLFSRSSCVWERRISVLSTFHYIKQGNFSETLQIAKLLLNDPEDLIQKAVGWMLREIGKRDLATEEGLLARYYKQMPRTMLRYAIEKFPEERRKKYLKGLI